MEIIKQEHPEYRAQAAVLRRYSDLYAGGEQLKERAAEYLARRQKEPQDVYGERLSRVFYENYAGSIIDWYAATLFKREPVLNFEGEESRGRNYFSSFTEDCDMRGTSFAGMLQQQFVSALVHGKSYLLVDFPKATVQPLTRAQEDEYGLSRAYVVNYSAQDLVNWSVDEHGVYEWAVLRQVNPHRVLPDGRVAVETRWLYFDRETYRVYKSLKEGTGESEPELIDEGAHGLSGLHTVPLFELKVSEGLWLMNKAALLQLEHFNKSNALGYALSMGLFAMPVVYTERDWQQMVGESYYLQLGPQDRFGWTEPEGKVFQIAAQNLTRLQEEIYRICYLLHQSSGVHSSGFSQSGLSKQRDFSVTMEVLRAYGDVVKDYAKKILRTINAARADGLEIGVSGMDDFDIGEFSNDLGDAERLLQLGVESPTLKAEIFKKLAGKYLCDARQGVKDQINREIEASLFG
ncbi:MAG: hypothetical protein HYZ37_10165 [Candidatus Solibacter usitatus]|nr:hypothetical protein [Candidatus Solibacter usitatus]